MMTVFEEVMEPARCVECGHPAGQAATIPALDGRGRRCANQEDCHDRKEARSAFSASIA